MVHAIWDYAMWSDTVPIQSNPATVVRIEDVSKRQRQPHPPANAVQQKLMRHADIRTTMNVYGDAVTDEREQAHSKVVRLALATVN